MIMPYSYIQEKKDYCVIKIFFLNDLICLAPASSIKRLIFVLLGV